MTADSDPPEEPSAEADGDHDAETAESAEPSESEDRPADEEPEIDRRSPFEDDEDGSDGPTNGADADADDGDARESGENRDTGDSDGGGADESGGNGGGADESGDADADADGDRGDDPEKWALEPTPIDGDAPDGDSPDVDESQPVPDAVAGERSDERGQPAANGGAESAMTAAQKGMDAVNKGVGALGGGEGGGPDTDQEMPLAEHIEEMMRRLGIVFGIAGVVVVAVLLIGTVSPTVPSAEQIIEFLWDSHVGFEQNQPRVYGPLEFLLTKLKVAALAGLLVGLPVFVYETYRFMRPGLYPHERRYYLAAVPTSLILGIIGVAFAHFIVLPVIFDYFISYTEESAILAFSLRETFNLILLLMGYMAIVFQIPLFIQLAIMMGLVTREWMEDRRLLFWSAFVGLAFIVSPDPTGMAPIIVGATMIALFEGTLALLRWTGN